jgi:hypothetical protein
MSMYSRPIVIRKLGPKWVRIEEDVNVFGVDIPAGFELDGVSVPRIFWTVISPFTEGFRAALVHDFRHKDWPISHKQRLLADEEMFINLLRDGVDYPRAYLVWFALRWYANTFFWKFTKESS